MTSISATSGNTYLSPLQQLQDQLQTDVNSGAVASTDQGALSSALTDINSSLQSGAAGDPSSNSNSSPGDLKSKIDGLIANEVSSGKLTTDQASELQDVFKQAFAVSPGGPGGADPAAAASGAGGAHAHAAHHGHHGGHGGPPPADASSSADGTSSTSSADDVLQQFLQSLQNSLSASSPTSYTSSGSSTPAGDSSSSFSALLINYQT
jgi:hypothetical protein